MASKGRKLSGIWVPVQLDTSRIESDLTGINTKLARGIESLQKVFDGAINTKKLADGFVNVTKRIGEIKNSVELLQKTGGALLGDYTKDEKQLTQLNAALREMGKTVGIPTQELRKMYEQMARTQAVDQQVIALTNLQKSLGLTGEQALELAKKYKVSEEAFAKFRENISAPIKATAPLKELETHTTRLAAKYRELSTSLGISPSTKGFEEYRQKIESIGKVSAFNELYDSTKLSEKGLYDLAKAANLTQKEMGSIGLNFDGAGNLVLKKHRELETEATKLAKNYRDLAEAMRMRPSQEGFEAFTKRKDEDASVEKFVNSFKQFNDISEMSERRLYDVARAAGATVKEYRALGITVTDTGAFIGKAANDIAKLASVKLSGIEIPVKLDQSKVDSDLNALSAKLAKGITSLQNVFGGLLDPNKLSNSFVGVIRSLKEVRNGAEAVAKADMFTGLTGDASKLSGLQSILRSLSKDIDIPAQSLREMLSQMGKTQAVNLQVSSLKNLQSELGLTGSQVLSLARQLKVSEDAYYRLSDSVYKSLKPISTTADEIRKIAPNAKLSEKSFNELTEAMRKFSTAQAGVRRISAIVEATGMDIAALRKYKDELKITEAAIRKYQDQQSRGSSGRGVAGLLTPYSMTSGIQAGAAAVGVSFGAYGIAELGKAAVNASLKMDNINLAFQSIYGSAQEASSVLEFVRAESDRLGISFIETAEGAKKLFAASKGTVLEKDAQGIFKSFSTMGAALKLSGDEMNSVFLAISQMISKGKVSAEELRLQLAERMPGAVTLFAKSIGVTTQELDKMLQAGAVGLEDLRKFAITVGKTYEKGALDASKGLQAEINRLSTAWFFLKEATVDADASADIVRYFTSITESITVNIDGILTFTKVLLGLGTNVAGITLLYKSSVLAGIGISKLKDILVSVRGALAATTLSATGMAAAATSLKTMFASMLHPVAAVVTLVAAAAAGAYLWSTRATEAQKITEKYSASLDELVKKSNEAAEAQGNLSQQTANRTVDTFRKQISAIQKEFETLTKGGFAEQLQDLMPKDAPTVHYGGSWADRALLGKDFESLDVKFNKKVRGLLEGTQAEFDKFSIEIIKEDDIDKQKVLVNDLTSYFANVKANLIDIDAPKEAIEGFDKLAGSVIKLAGETNSLKEAFEAAKKSATFKDIGIDISRFEDAFNAVKKATSGTDLAKSIEAEEAVKSIASAFVTMGSSALEAEQSLIGLDESSENSAEKLANAELVTSSFAKAVTLLSQDAVKSKVGLEVFEKSIELAGEAAKLTDDQIRTLQATFSKGFKLEGTKAVEDILGELEVEKLLSKASKGVKKAYSVLSSDLQDKAMRPALLKALGEGSLEGIDIKFKNVAITKSDFEDILSKAKETASILDESSASSTSRGKVRSEILNKTLDVTKKIEELNAKLGERKGESYFVGISKELEKIDLILAEGKGTEEQKKKLKEVAAEFENLGKKVAFQIDTAEFESIAKEYNTLSRRISQEFLKTSGADNEAAIAAARERQDNDLALLKQYYDKAEALKRQYTSDEIKKLKESGDEVVLATVARYEAALKVTEDYEKKKEELRAIYRDQERRNSEDLYDVLGIAVDDYYKKFDKITKNIGGVVTNVMDSMASAIGDFAVSGARDFDSLGKAFSNLADDMLSTVAKLLAQQAISGLFSMAFNAFGTPDTISSVSKSPMSDFSWLGNNAKGGAFTGLSSHSNSIVTAPTLFSSSSKISAFAKGAGLMGESGPEAIMPLIRSSSGYLGVRAEMGGGQGVALNQSINVNVVNNAGVDVEQRQSRDEEGNVSLEILLEKQQAEAIGRSGSAPFRALTNVFGVSPALANR